MACSSWCDPDSRAPGASLALYHHTMGRLGRFHPRLFVANYDKALKNKPLLVKSVSAAVIVFLSDTVVQHALPQTSASGGSEHTIEVAQTDIWQYDPWRSAVIGVGYGGLCFAPILHTVTTFWARVLPSRY